MVYAITLRRIINNFGTMRRALRLSAPTMIQVGDNLPECILCEGTPGNKVNIRELCNKKKVIIFGLPGAFTPGCSRTHVPGYLKNYKLIRSKGVHLIICISVNDAFVMEAWAKEQNTEGKIRMLADPDAAFTTAMNLHIEIPALGGIRSKRYSMVVDDNVVKKISIEPDGTGLSCTLAEKFLV
ncbi:UNVERIFIED_CONTAM: hypothetical protein PYX00_009676 [Menopon gallinae]|uniref:Peroxiredoxin-5 n=1 Tax=Menopon gallinae TaxID=328185 RepID=A0AAW2HBT3_9NEOP